MITITLPDRPATTRLAAAIAPQLHGGDLIELAGDLGVGKTTFTAELARMLGCSDTVRSPTYTVAHSYPLADGKSLSHLDLYRLTGGLDDASYGDLEPAFAATFVVVEWPQNIAAWLPDRPRWQITLQHAGGDRRCAGINPPRAFQLPDEQELVV